MKEDNVSDDELNPWGGPTEGRMNSSLVDTLLSAAVSGAEILRLMKPSSIRSVRLEKLWTLWSTAEGMILREQGRGRRMAARRDEEVKKLLDRPLVEDEDEEEFDGPGENYSSF